MVRAYIIPKSDDETIFKKIKTFCKGLMSKFMRTFAAVSGNRSTEMARVEHSKRPKAVPKIIKFF